MQDVSENISSEYKYTKGAGLLTKGTSYRCEYLKKKKRKRNALGMH